MSVLIGALLGILAIGVVLYPFIGVRFRSQSPSTQNAPGPASGKGLQHPGGREAIYENIRTLQLEYELGSIEEVEYSERLRDYRLQAAANLRDQEQLEREIDRSLEEEILALRSLRGNKQASYQCRSCGGPVAQRDGVCPNCGLAGGSHTPDRRQGGKDEGDPR